MIAALPTPVTAMRHRLALAVCAALALSACHSATPPADPATAAPAPDNTASAAANSSASAVGKLGVVDTKLGTGAEAKPGMTVSVLYTGWLYDATAKDHHGAKFDSTDDHGGGAFAFPLGQGQVIEGWDKGVAGMRVGGERTLLIPAALGYGERGAGGVIPPNAALVFDVKLVGVSP